MSDVRMSVNAGACMFVTELTGDTEDFETVLIKMESKCPHVMKLAAAMPEAKIMDAIVAPIDQNPILVECGKHLAHAACPVPIAIIKLCEAVGQLCLKKDVSMTYLK